MTPTKKAAGIDQPLTLDRDGATPMYKQLAAGLARQIDRGELKSGQRLPSEATLMERFQVSRITVRQATSLLQKQGRLIAQQGKGCFVAARVVPHELDVLQGFYDSLRDQGIEPQTELLEFSADAGLIDPDRSTQLDLPVRLRRLYTVDAAPFAVVVGYLPQAAAALGFERAQHLNLYQILQDFLGLPVLRADLAIRCLKPPKDIAKALGLRSSDVTLVMERETYSRASAPCEFMRVYIVPERYEFRMHVTSPVGLHAKQFNPHKSISA